MGSVCSWGQGSSPSSAPPWAPSELFLLGSRAHMQLFVGAMLGRRKVQS